MGPRGSALKPRFDPEGKRVTGGSGTCDFIRAESLGIIGGERCRQKAIKTDGLRRGSSEGCLTATSQLKVTMEASGGSSDVERVRCRLYRYFPSRA